jgi:hypothetical protein
MAPDDLADLSPPTRALPAPTTSTLATLAAAILAPAEIATLAGAGPRASTAPGDLRSRDDVGGLRDQLDSAPRTSSPAARSDLRHDRPLPHCVIPSPQRRIAAQP